MSRASKLSPRHRCGVRLPLVLILPVLAAALLAGLAALDLAGAAKAGVAPQREAALSLSSELPLGAGADGASRPAALARGGLALVAVETTRRKMRAPQRPPAQPLSVGASFVPIALARLFTRRQRPQRPLRASRPPRPFYSQGPPSRNAS